jgi:type VI protein secretion system component Hcp
MSSAPLLGRVSTPIRIFALAITALLVAAAFVALSQRDPQAPRAPHFLGMRQLQLDAFDGKAQLFLRLPPITPTSSPSHATDIPLTGLSWSVSSPTVIGSPGGGGTGRAALSAFTVTKPLDKFTPKLLAGAFDGTHLSSATIYVLPAVQRNDPEQLVYKLTDPIVSADHENATRTSSSETITFSYLKIQVEYVRSGSVRSQTVYQPPAAG